MRNLGIEPVTTSLGIGAALVSAVQNIALPLFGEGLQTYLSTTAAKQQLKTQQSQRAEQQQQVAQQYAEQYRQQRLVDLESQQQMQRIKSVAATGIFVVAAGAAAYIVYKAVRRK